MTLIENCRWARYFVENAPVAPGQVALFWATQMQNKREKKGPGLVEFAMLVSFFERERNFKTAVESLAWPALMMRK